MQLTHSQCEESQVQRLTPISVTWYRICSVIKFSLSDVWLQRSEMTCCGRLFQTVGAAWENKRSVKTVVLIPTSGPVSTGMGDRVCLGSIPSAGHLSQCVTTHPGQLSLAIPSWVGAMSTSQRAVTFTSADHKDKRHVELEIADRTEYRVGQRGH